MEINDETIRHLADLSKMTISDAETKSLGGDLQNIINYIQQLDELNVGDVKPTYQVTGLKNVWRSDEIKPQDASSEELLALAKEVKDNQVKVPKVL